MNYRIVVSHRSNHLNPQMSSVVCIAALCKLAKKVNIFGWDQYLEFEPAKCGYWRTLFGMIPNGVPRPGRVEQALWNYHYSYRFGKLPFINIKGRIAQIEHHPELMSKINKVFHNDQIFE